jgi:inorganic pyrophosphatase
MPKLKGLTVMNIWHGISPNRIQSEDFVAVIEISKGGKTKYELDKDTGMIIRNYSAG